MTYNWFKIFSYSEFIASGLVSREYTVVLENIGEKTILVTKGVAVGMLYEGIFLSLNLNAVIPFAFEGHAIYKDTNNDVWLGIEIEN